jgi:surfeit locus 1 family protein
VRRYRFLLKPVWLIAHLVVVVVAVLFINLGFWQLRRQHQQNSYNALLESRLEAAPLPFDTLLNRYDLTAKAADADAAAYRTVRVQGRYDPAHEVLWRSKEHNGQPGYDVLTPLVLPGGKAILVNRGWVPYADDTPPITQATPPEGPLTLTGVVLPAQPEPHGLAAKDPPTGKLSAVFWVNPARLQAQMPYALEPVFLSLIAQTPPQSGTYPILPGPPPLSTRNNFSYALQWFSFTLIGLVGYAFLIRQGAREDRAKRRKARATAVGKP